MFSATHFRSILSSDLESERSKTARQRSHRAAEKVSSHGGIRMVSTIAKGGVVEPGSFAAARALTSDAVPWVPLSEGKSFKPLRFLSGNRGFVELLRLQPGASIPRHRHTGEVHAFNLEGWRQLCSGEIISPGDYVYEPAGNVDSWRNIGDSQLVVLVVAMGFVENLGPD